MKILVPLIALAALIAAMKYAPVSPREMRAARLEQCVIEQSVHLQAFHDDYARIARAACEAGDRLTAEMAKTQARARP